jgi:adenosylhomocysteine nucleosidase
LEGSTGFYQEPLAESTGVLTSSEEKRKLSSRTGAIAVDMESAAVAGVAREAGVPFAVIRALLDPVEMAIPDRVLTVVDEFGRLNVLKLIRQLVEHPGEVFCLLAMRRNFRAVQTALARVLDLAGKNLLVS